MCQGKPKGTKLNIIKMYLTKQTLKTADRKEVKNKI